MLEIESIKGENVVTGDSLGVGMARLGQPTQKVLSTLCEFSVIDASLLDCIW